MAEVLKTAGYQTYMVDLAAEEDFAGLITGIRFQFSDMETNDRVRVERICFE